MLAISMPDGSQQDIEGVKPDWQLTVVGHEHADYDVLVVNYYRGPVAKATFNLPKKCEFMYILKW
jgi:hypothetical protein